MRVSLGVAVLLSAECALAAIAPPVAGAVYCPLSFNCVLLNATPSKAASCSSITDVTAYLSYPAMGSYNYFVSKGSLTSKPPQQNGEKLFFTADITNITALSDGQCGPYTTTGKKVEIMVQGKNVVPPSKPANTYGWNYGICSGNVSVCPFIPNSQ